MVVDRRSPLHRRAQLSDENFDKGLAALERAAAEEAEPRPVEARIDLLVLR
jgi:hypothetical protein